MNNVHGVMGLYIGSFYETSRGWTRGVTGKQIFRSGHTELTLRMSVLGYSSPRWSSRYQGSGDETKQSYILVLRMSTEQDLIATRKFCYPRFLPQVGIFGHQSQARTAYGRYVSFNIPIIYIPVPTTPHSSASQPERLPTETIQAYIIKPAGP